MTSERKFTVTMRGESGDLEVHDNPGADRPEIDSWDAAIRAAWVRVGRFGVGGWTSAVITGPLGRTVHIHGDDKDAREAAMVARTVEDLEREDADPPVLTPLFD